MYAIPFGTDGLSGDSAFYPCANNFEAPENATFGELLSLYEKTDIGQDALADEVLDELAGFWIVDENVVTAMVAVWPNDGCGGDSETYRCNSATKQIASKLAKRTVLRE